MPAIPDRFTFKARAFARYHGYTDKPGMIEEKAQQMREAYYSGRWQAPWPLESRSPAPSVSEPSPAPSHEGTPKP